MGAGSRSEYFDVRLRSYVAPDEALAALQAAAPENLMPVECAYRAHGDDAIDVMYPVSVWRAELVCERASVDDVARAFGQLVDRGFIEVTKTKGRKTTAKRVEFAGRLVDGPHVTADGDVMTVDFSTFQGNEGALRPDKFIAAACELMGDQVTVRSLTRMELREA